jgi:prepilin-type N-terminal cleavage/methylation domain-containing protein
MCSFLYFKIRKGFTLAEILWAVVIMGFIIVMVTSVFTGILMASRKNEKTVVSMNLAQKMVEYLKEVRYNDILTTDCDTGREWDGTVLNNVTFGSKTLQLKETVDNTRYYYKIKTSWVTPTKIKSILVTVLWDATENEGKYCVTLELYKSM